jgi:hypothetical protein
MQDTLTAPISTFKEFGQTPRIDWSAPHDKITEQLQNIGHLVLIDENGQLRSIFTMNNLNKNVEIAVMRIERKANGKMHIYSLQDKDKRSTWTKQEIKKLLSTQLISSTDLRF